MLPPILEFDRITKRFPGVTALDEVSFAVVAGECHAIIGENGAGKSTLGKIVAGIYRPDGGQVLIAPMATGWKPVAQNTGQRPVPQTTWQRPMPQEAGQERVPQETGNCAAPLASDLTSRTPNATHGPGAAELVPQHFRSPLDAAAAGISIVHQELAFCPNLSIAENLFLGAAPAWRGFVRRREMLERARDMLTRVGLALDPGTPMEQLSTAQEQLVQIAVAIGRGARIVIMDEPTSSLAQAEVERLFALLTDLRRSGVTVLYVSHRMEEIFRLCDRISVLRDGRYIRTLETAATTADEIVRLMIGRPVAEYIPSCATTSRGPAVLSVSHVSSRGRFDDICFDVHAGEIVGVAGLVGAGRSELARAIFGIDQLESGSIAIAGAGTGANASRPALRDPLSAIRQGIGLLPEDRKRQGLVLSMSCKENLTLSLLDRLKRWLFIRHTREVALARDYFARLRVRTPDIDAVIDGLSGGNQQKIALAKWLARDCRVLILDEPTRGVDVGAKAEMHALIAELAAAGRAILLISSELPELLGLSTRILVLRQGRLVGELPRAGANQESLMRLMAGVTTVSK